MVGAAGQVCRCFAVQRQLLEQDSVSSLIASVQALALDAARESMVLLKNDGESLYSVL